MMRWQPLARRINDKLIATGEIETTQLSDLVDFSSHADGLALFRAWYRIIAARGAGIGWNKEWQKSELIGWYGSVTTTQSFEAIALEIEDDETGYKTVRSWLNSVFNPGDKHEPAVNDEDGKMLLMQFGISTQMIEKNSNARRLLQKLNLDQRELPVVERWRWSKNRGLGYLSNDGRIQVSLEMVWARAVESAISVHNKMTEDLRDFLAAVEPDERETLLENIGQDDAFSALINKLNFYGLAEHLNDRIRFRVSPGDFPKLALSLWW